MRLRIRDRSMLSRSDYCETLLRCVGTGTKLVVYPYQCNGLFSAGSSRVSWVQYLSLYYLCQRDTLPASLMECCCKLHAIRYDRHECVYRMSLLPVRDGVLYFCRVVSPTLVYRVYRGLSGSLRWCCRVVYLTICARMYVSRHNNIFFWTCTLTADLQLMEPLITSALSVALRPQLEIRELEVAFEGRVIITSLSFSIYEGERLFISGPSGVGKSRLLRAISHLDQFKVRTSR